MNTPNDTQLAIVEQLTSLNEKLNQFINGDVNTIVATDAGPIKSLAGIVRDLTSFRFVQKIIDHRLYSDIIADDSNIEVGMLVRLWGESDPSINGIYKKLEGDRIYIKVSYTDLYDLIAPSTP